MINWVLGFFRKKECDLCNKFKSVNNFNTKWPYCNNCVDKIIYNSKTKTCTRCGIVKEYSKFSKDRRKKDGLRSWCKRCDSETRLKRHREIKANKTKRCPLCLEYKEILQFNKKSDSNDGLQPYCRECSRIKSRKYRNSKNGKAKFKPNKYVVDELGIVTFRNQGGS